MRINEEVILVGQKVVLVPYRAQHVPKYHEWMTDPAIREMTASEPLSLEEEFEMQRSWHLDGDKLTFIVLSQSDSDSSLSPPQTAQEALRGTEMVGDVNLFINESVDEDEDEDEGANESANETTEMTRGASPQEGSQTRKWDAECEVMIAEPSARRKGLAYEALCLLISYASSTPTPTFSSSASLPTSPNPLPLPLSRPSFLAKIGLSNTGSQALFERLGFEKVKVSEVWQEVEMRIQHETEAARKVWETRPVAVVRWPMEAELDAEKDEDKDEKAAN